MRGLKLVVFGMLLFVGGCILRFTWVYIFNNGGAPSVALTVQYSMMTVLGLMIAVYGLFRSD